MFWSRKRFGLRLYRKIVKIIQGSISVKTSGMEQGHGEDKHMYII